MGPCGPFEIRICFDTEPLVMPPALWPKEVEVLNPANRSNIRNQSNILLCFIILFIP
jgi:hypothetical protein